MSAMLNPEAKARVSTCCGSLRSVAVLRPVEALTTSSHFAGSSPKARATSSASELPSVATALR